MTLIEVFQTTDGKTVRIDKGIFEAGTFRIDGDVALMHDTNDWSTHRTYDPKKIEGLHWTKLQDDGNGWEVVFDSREGIDRSIEYDLPAWFANPSLGVPLDTHRMNGDDVEREYRGYME